MDISKTCDDECKEVVVAEDLILEILFRVPSFSVSRFKFACKSWYSLISNPDLLFLKHYHLYQQSRLLLDHHSDDILLISNDNDMVGKEDRQQHNEYVFLLPQSQNKEELKMFLDHALSVKFPSCSSQLIDSCNGLLLYRNENNPISGGGGGETQYHVFNPITKQCFELPLIDRFGNNFSKGIIYWLHIVFDPSVSLSFKVLICFATALDKGNSGIYVYSSSSSSESETTSSSSWKYLSDEFIPGNFPQFRAVLLDGFLYMYKSPYKLLCFDVVKDKIRFLSVPSSSLSWRNRRIFLQLGIEDSYMFYFGEVGGRLQFIRRYPDDNSDLRQPVTTPFSLYIMELKLKVRHGKSMIRNWTVKHNVDINVNYEDQIMHIYKTGAGKKDEALLFLNKDHNMVISYNLTSNTFGEERQISGFDRSHHLDAFRFTPTLFPFSC